MNQKYEYKFVRIDASFWGGLSKADQSYRQELDEHVRDGWRLVQIFSPSIGLQGMATFYELILERELEPRE